MNFKMKQSLKETAYVFLTLAVIVSFSFIYEDYFQIQSEGFRTGSLQKFSHFGNTFQTHEGEMILANAIENKNISMESEKFVFSVTDKKLIQQLDTIQGQLIIVHFKQKNKTLFRKGNSLYQVDSIKLK